MPTASRKSMQTTGSAKAKADAKAVGPAIPTGLSGTALTQAMGHYKTLGPVITALSAAETEADYAKALAVAKRDQRDPDRLATLARSAKDLTSELTKAVVAHTALRQTMVRTYRKWHAGASDMELATVLFGLPENGTSKQAARRVRLAVELRDAMEEWNAKATREGDKHSLTPEAAAATVNEVEKTTGLSMDTVKDRAKTGQELIPREPKAASGGSIVSGLQTVRDRIDALDPKGLTPEQAAKVRASIEALVLWAARMPVTVTVTKTADTVAEAS